ATVFTTELEMAKSWNDKINVTTVALKKIGKRISSENVNEVCCCVVALRRLNTRSFSPISSSISHVILHIMMIYMESLETQQRKNTPSFSISKKTAAFATFTEAYTTSPNH